MLIDTFQFEALSEVGVDFDPIAHFVRALPQSIYLAELAVRRADSYRVKVASVFQAINREKGLLGTFVTWNDKPTPHIRKRCAETKGWLEARDEGYTEPVGSVIKGPAERRVINSITPVATATLHACGDCLHTAGYYMQEGKLRLTGDTPFVTTTGLAGRTEVHDYSEMLALHGYGTSLNQTPEQVFNGLDQANWSQIEAAYYDARQTTATNPDELILPAQLIRRSLAAA